MALTINEKDFQVLRLLGKGKGGYSWLVTDGAGEYVIKQIHHEPCDYYQFGDKLASERQDYARLVAAGAPVPKLLAVDEQQERHIKELKELILGRETKPKEESEELSYEDDLMAKIRQKIKK